MKKMYFCDISNFHFNFFFATVPWKKLEFSLFLREKDLSVKYGTFSVYVFPKFDKKNYSIWLKTERENIVIHYIDFTKIAATVPLCIVLIWLHSSVLTKQIDSNSNMT